MRQIRQALRLHLEAGLSYAQVARAVGIGKGTVGKFMLLARAAGVDRGVAQTLSDAELEARLYRPAVPRSSRQLEPDYAWIHQELKRPGVTLQLLREEYQRQHSEGGEAAYKYTSFCVKYRALAASLKRSMRQVHLAGERLFVDYAGQTVPVIDAATGEIRRAQIFVAVLGEPAVNRLGDEFCDHYDVAVLPARPAHPRDKAWTSYCTLFGWLSGNSAWRPTAVSAAGAFNECDVAGRFVQASMVVAVQVALEDAKAAELVDGRRGRTEVLGDLFASEHAALSQPLEAALERVGVSHHDDFHRERLPLPIAVALRVELRSDLPAAPSSAD